MSIEDNEGRKIIRLGTVHEAAFKVSIWLCPLLAVWLVTTVLRHDRELAVLQSQVNRGAVSQAVNISDSGLAGEVPVASRKEYLTTAEVAAREKISTREVVDKIATGEIQPPPTKNGREWIVAKDYRITPPTAAACGEN